MVALAAIAKEAGTRFYCSALEQRDYKEKDYALWAIARHGSEYAVGPVVRHVAARCSRLRRGASFPPALVEAALFLVRQAALLPDSRVEDQALRAIWGKWDLLDPEERERLCAHVPFLRELEERMRAPPPLRFNPILVLAVAADRSETFSRLAREKATWLADALGAVLRAKQRRPWGHAFGDLAYSDAIDSRPGALFRADRHAGAPHLGILEGEWAPF